MDQFIGEEVFVAVSEEDTVTGIYIYDDIEGALEHLAGIDPLEEAETKVFHGVLTRAESIPSEIKAKSCYIIAINIYHDLNRSDGVLYQSDCEGDPDALANDVETTISSSIYETNSLFIYDIENIYILYGYEVTTGLCINRESLDEEIVHTCKTIAVEAMEMSKKYIND